MTGRWQGGALGEGNKRLHDDCTTIQKLLKGGYSSLGEDASPSSSCSKKNLQCYTSKRRRLTARHSNLGNRIVF